MKPRRDWYVAVGSVSGEFEGNPLSFEASDVYGPFTAAQAEELLQLGHEFPAASHEVWIFKVAKRKRFAGVRTMLRKLIAEDVKDAAEDGGARLRPRGDET